MTLPFPAWFDLMNDKVMAKHPHAIRVYGYCLRTFPKIFFEPQDVKAWVIALELVMGRDTANESLDLLIERRYLVSHGRAEGNIRRVTMAIVRERLPSGSAEKSAEG